VRSVWFVNVPNDEVWFLPTHDIEAVIGWGLQVLASNFWVIPTTTTILDSLLDSNAVGFHSRVELGTADVGGWNKVLKFAEHLIDTGLAWFTHLFYRRR